MVSRPEELTPFRLVTYSSWFPFGSRGEPRLTEPTRDNDCQSLRNLSSRLRWRHCRPGQGSPIQGHALSPGLLWALTDSNCRPLPCKFSTNRFHWWTFSRGNRVIAARWQHQFRRCRAPFFVVARSFAPFFAPCGTGYLFGSIAALTAMSTAFRISSSISMAGGPLCLGGSTTLPKIFRAISSLTMI
jgi:hypothetical protein